MIRYSWCRRAELVLYPSHLCHLLTHVGGLVLILYCTCYEMCVQEYGILNLCSFMLYAVCGKSKSPKEGHCISTKPWWIWTLPSVHCCMVSAVTCYKFWKCDNLLEFDEGFCYFWIFHPVGTLAFVVWCLYKIFWGVFLFCVSWILLQGSIKNVRGKGDRRGSTGTEMRSYALHCAMDWMGNCSCVCPFCYSTAWLAVKGSVNINPTWDTVCALYFHHFVFNKHEHWLEMTQVSRIDVSVICFELEFE